MSNFYFKYLLFWMHIMTPVLKTSRRLFLEISSGTLFRIMLHMKSAIFKCWRTIIFVFWFSTAPKTVGLIDTFYIDDWSISIKSVCLHMFDWLLDWMLIFRFTKGNNLNKKFQVFWVNWGKKSYSKSYSTCVIRKQRHFSKLNVWV